MDKLAKTITDHFLDYDKFLADELDILAIVFSGSVLLPRRRLDSRQSSRF